jgi:hypothetical protein
MCRLENDLKTPTSCRVTLKDFEFMFDVERVQGTEYRIHGTAIPLIADTARQIGTGGFIFFFTDQGVVVDSVTILAAPTRVDTSQSLLLRFETQETFDAITVGYEVSSGRSRKGVKGPTAWSIPPTLLE